jgi:hypothetical protein
MLHCRLNPREDEIGNLQIAFILHDHVIVPSVRCELERLSEIFWAAVAAENTCRQRGRRSSEPSSPSGVILASTG